MVGDIKSPTKSTLYVRPATTAARSSQRPSFVKRKNTIGGESSSASPLTREVSVVSGKDKEIMAASFLQYCAMCERQITTPCNSILYCSEACKRKDSNKPLSASYTPSSTSLPSSPRPCRPNRFSSSESHSYTETPVIRIPSDLHDHKSDLDPTEWKPKLRDRPHSTSAAYQYLTQFHQSTGGIEGGQGELVKAERPRLMHKSTTNSLATPSLGNTPTTTNSASSFDSYDFHMRPLPMRHNPAYAFSPTAKSIDLVTPHVAPPSDSTLSGSMLMGAGGQYNLGKKVAINMDSVERGDGLGALFGRAR